MGSGRSETPSIASIPGVQEQLGTQWIGFYGTGEDSLDLIMNIFDENVRKYRQLSYVS